jgi:hypothetical protein
VSFIGRNKKIKRNMTILSLGRYGDLINLLPMAYAENKRGNRTTFVVSQEFRPLFDGVSYCDVRTYSNGPIDLAGAIRACQGLPDLRVCQPFQNPDQRHLTNSFAKEAYRLGGFLSEFGKHPTVFDRRDYVREHNLLMQAFNGMLPRPFIALALDGISSPFANHEHLRNKITQRFPEHQVIDLSQVKADRIYDLLGTMDCASCLVTIDTVHLWLANAAKCPTVALVNDDGDGWRASPAPSTAIASYGYSQAQSDQICDSIESCLLPTGDTVLVADIYGTTPRHKKAQKSWKRAFDKVMTPKNWIRTAHEIGDSRPLPMLKTMLEYALMFAEGRDVIVWTNDDVTVHDMSAIEKHVRRFGVVSVRRDPSHIGREMVAFRWDWLADRIHHFPDVAIACPWFDLAIAAWIRQQFGIVSTMENISEDRYPCELPSSGVFTHEPHESHWTAMMDAPAAKWNERIFNSVVKE